MKKILDNEKKKLEIFWDSKKGLYIFILMVTLTTYASKILLYNYSIDTEQFMKDPSITLNWWLRIDRYGLVFLKKIFSFGMDINVILINIVTYLLLALSAVVLCYLVWRVNRNDDKDYIYFISSALYISAPVMLEQTNFILQSVEVVLSFILLFISIIFLQIGTENKKMIFYFFSFILSIISFSVYPSNQVAFVVLAAMSIYFSLSNERLNLFGYFSKTFPYMAVLACSFVGNSLISRIVIRLFNLEHSSYLMDGSLVGKVSKKELLTKMISDYKEFFLHPNNFFLSTLTFLGILLLMIILIRKSYFSYKIYSFLSITMAYLAVVSPLFYLGWIGPIRSLAPTAPVLLFLFSYLALYLIKNKKISIVLLGFLSIVSLGQVKTTSDMGIAEYNVYQQEINLINEISYTLKSKEDFTNFSDYKLAIIGYKSFDDGYLPKTDVIGRSVFEWNYVRMRDFIYNHHLDFKDISTEEYNKAVKHSENMKSFPKEDSIRIVDDILIIKL